MKKLAILSASAFMFVFLAAGASADTTLVFTVEQDADITNVSNVTANTGGNTQTAGQDLMGASLFTGPAQSASSIMNNANFVGTSVTVEQNADDVTITNDIDQESAALNTTAVAANSGTNTQSAAQDVTDAETNTGAVTAVASISNGGPDVDDFFNKVFTVFNIGDPDADCNCGLASDVILDNNVDQTTDVVNTTDVAGNSGDNTQTAGQDLGGAGCNCDDGAVLDTGEVQVGSEINNFLNWIQTAAFINADDTTGTINDTQDSGELLNTSTVAGNSGTNTQSAAQDVSNASTSTGPAVSVDTIFNKLNEIFREIVVNG